MQRFEHYYNRFINHKESLLKAKEKHKRSLKSVEDIYQNLKEGTVLDFFTKATDLLISAKKSLSFSYALGYFLTSPFKLQFYEFIQGELESNMIKLDEKTELDLDNFIDSSSNQSNLNENFAQYRMEVISLTELVTKFFDDCMQQMESGFPNIVDESEENTSEDCLSALVNLNALDRWICGACTLANELQINLCSACGTERLF